MNIKDRPTIRLQESLNVLVRMMSTLETENVSEVIRFSIYVSDILVNRTKSSGLRAKNILNSLPKIDLIDRLKLGTDSDSLYRGSDVRIQESHANEFITGEIVMMLEEFLKNYQLGNIDYSELIEENEVEIVVKSEEELLVDSGFSQETLAALQRVKEMGEKAETERLKAELRLAEEQRLVRVKEEAESRDKRRNTTVTKVAKEATRAVRRIKEEEDFILQHGEKDLKMLLDKVKKGYGYYLFDSKETSYIIPVRIDLVGPEDVRVTIDSLYKQFVFGRVVLTPMFSSSQYSSYTRYATKHGIKIGKPKQLKSMIRKLVDITGTPLIQSGYLSDVKLQKDKINVLYELNLALDKDFEFNKFSPYSLVTSQYTYDFMGVPFKKISEHVVNVYKCNVYDLINTKGMTDNAKTRIRNDLILKMVKEVGYYKRYSNYFRKNKTLYQGIDKC